MRWRRYASEHPVTSRPTGTGLLRRSPDEQARRSPPPPGTRALRHVAARWPTLLEAWAGLAETADDPITSYAFARVGYHRGLDALRQAGWRGNGNVLASRDGNLGFLRSLDALRAAASAIGEVAETERCEQFLYQCDPHWRDVLGG